MLVWNVDELIVLRMPVAPKFVRRTEDVAKDTRGAGDRKPILSFVFSLSSRIAPVFLVID